MYSKSGTDISSEELMHALVVNPYNFQILHTGFTTTDVNATGPRVFCVQSLIKRVSHTLAGRNLQGASVLFFRFYLAICSSHGLIREPG